MCALRATIQESEPDRLLQSDDELLSALEYAAAQASNAGLLNIIFLRSSNGDQLSLVVGSDETVLGFQYGHGNPPYFVSAGTGTSDEPLLTAFAGLQHHTEFSRRWVVPMSIGRRAASQFLLTHARPSIVEWVEA